ncbi:MAG: RICIN domain-containing protein [Bacilli bacterium]
MKKNIIIKRVFFISLMLLNIVFITIYNRKLYASTLENNFILHSSIDRPEGISSAHYFTNGIADGGIYYIINKRTGKYLDVQNAETADGTKLWTYEGNQSNAQKFKINYLGQETYELVPQVSSKVVQISNENEDCNTIISKKNKGDKKQEFRIKAINSNTYRIYSNENNYVLAVSHTKIFGGFYKDNSYVVSKNYIFLENSAKDFAEWEIVSTGELEHSIYTRYYIKM